MELLDQVANLENKIESRKAIIGVIGLGYIGLSLLDAFGKANFQLLGYDNSQAKIGMLNNEESFIPGLPLESLYSLIKKNQLKVSADDSILDQADIIMICVPTSLDKHHLPDLSNLRLAFKIVLKHLEKDKLVILESSTYPGTTEEELLPLLELSHLKVGEDFFLANVPEVIDIGNPKYTISQIPRFIGGITPSCLAMAKLLYEKIGCQVLPCSSTRVSEAAKLLQNTYRLVNISLVNEMKMMFDRMKIDIWEVIKAASSKPYGFEPFFPGPGIGGDCIPVTPLYLAWKAKTKDGPTTLLDLGVQINEQIPHYVVSKVVQALNQQYKSINHAKILVLGIGYKKDVGDIRQAPSLKILTLLQEMMAYVHYNDPYVKELKNLTQYPTLNMTSETLEYETLNLYDAIVIITDHSIYDWSKIVFHSQLVIDTRNIIEKTIGYSEKVMKA